MGERERVLRCWSVTGNFLGGGVLVVKQKLECFDLLGVVIVAVCASVRGLRVALYANVCTCSLC